MTTRRHHSAFAGRGAAATSTEAIARLGRAAAIMRGAIKRNAPEGPIRNTAMVQLGVALESAIAAVEAATRKAKEPADG